MQWSLVTSLCHQDAFYLSSSQFQFSEELIQLFIFLPPYPVYRPRLCSCGILLNLLVTFLKMSNTLQNFFQPRYSTEIHPHWCALTLQFSSDYCARLDFNPRRKVTETLPGVLNCCGFHNASVREYLNMCLGCLFLCMCCVQTACLCVSRALRPSLLSSSQ